MAGAAGRMATGQSGVCRRNRRVDQNDPALRPMPARRAPGRAGSVGPLEDDDLPRRAAARRSGLRLARSTGRSTARRSAPGSSSSSLPSSSPAISSSWTICQATRSRASERRSRTPAPDCSPCLPTAPISTRSSRGSPNSRPCRAKPPREPSTPSSRPSQARSKPSPPTNAQTISQTQDIAANNEML